MSAPQRPDMGVQGGSQEAVDASQHAVNATEVRTAGTHSSTGRGQGEPMDLTMKEPLDLRTRKASD